MFNTQAGPTQPAMQPDVTEHVQALSLFPMREC